MTEVNPRTIQNIAIIGAGPSGLAAAKYPKQLICFFMMIADKLQISTRREFIFPNRDL